MKTVITYGVYDQFHEGHERFLERAKKLGDRLIVAVTTSEFAVKCGKLCVVDTLETRMQHVRSCPWVDEVIIEDHSGQMFEDIQRLHADILAMGDDWLGKFDVLKPFCEVVYLPCTPGISSALLRNTRYYPYLRIGMIGAGRIAERFMREVGYVRGITVPCVYHPQPDTSLSLNQFLSRHTSVAKVRTLEKLFSLTDAIYIASPHDSHYAYAKAALEAGRHVLCEKPLCLCGEQAEELYGLPEKNGLILMEAIKTAYCPGFIQLCAIAQSGYIGKIVNVESCFTRLTPPGLREWNDHTYGGSFTELGSYPLLAAVKLLGTEGIDVEFQSVLNDDGLDIFTRVILKKDGQLASGCCGLGAKSEGSLIVSGTRGYIYAHAPWWKTTCFDIRTDNPQEVNRFTNVYDGDGLRYEIADFLYRTQGHPGRDMRLTANESVWIARIMERFLEERFRRQR